MCCMKTGRSVHKRIRSGRSTYFLEIYKPKYPEAALCPVKDVDEIIACHELPAQNWQNI